MTVYSQDFIDRFWSHVDKTSNSRGCWLWTAETDKDGYGQIRTARPHRKWLKAHRVAWEITVGPIPEGLHVLHKPPCATKACILHLYTGTNKDNIHDKLRAHPQTGERSHLARLTQVEVLEIRRLYATAQYTQKTLAALYHVSRQHISTLVNGGAWTELPFDTDLRAVRQHNQTKGEAQNFAKLTAKQVATIRSYAHAGIPKYAIAANFNVSLTTIWHVVTRKTWKHVP